MKGTMLILLGLAFPYQDISVQLLEWLEVNRILGVSKVFMYYLQLQKKTLEALKHHKEELGFMELTYLPLPGEKNWSHPLTYFNFVQVDIWYNYLLYAMTAKVVLTMLAFAIHA